MRVERLRSDPVRMTVRLSGVDAGLLCAIRHALLMDVRVYAADTVTFIKYDGPLESEYISLRLGQLPIVALDGDGIPEDATASFELDAATDPSTPKLTWLTSVDVKCTAGRAAVVHYRSEDEAARAGHDTGFLICPLHAGQRVHVRFTACAGTGRRGVRWKSVHVTQRTLVEGDAYELDIETTGAIAPERAWMQALRALRSRLDAMYALV